MRGWFFGAAHPRFSPLDHRHSLRLAALHDAAFARGWSTLDFEALLASESVIGDGLFFDSDLDGFILSRRVLDEGEILGLAVATKQRGKGHGTALLRSHLQRLERSGVRSLHLEVEEGNAAAIALYRRAGFAPTGKRAGYYAKADGLPKHALTMKRVSI